MHIPNFLALPSKALISYFIPCEEKETLKVQWYATLLLFKSQSLMMWPPESGAATTKLFFEVEAGQKFIVPVSISLTTVPFSAFHCFTKPSLPFKNSAKAYHVFFIVWLPEKWLCFDYSWWLYSWQNSCELDKKQWVSWWPRWMSNHLHWVISMFNVPGRWMSNHSTCFSYSHVNYFNVYIWLLMDQLYFYPLMWIIW